METVLNFISANVIELGIAGAFFVIMAVACQFFANRAGKDLTKMAMGYYDMWAGGANISSALAKNCLLLFVIGCIINFVK